MTNIDDVFAAIPDAQAITVDDSVDFVIDSNLRVISIPVRGVVLGVEGDKDVNRVTFLMPKMYKGVDLSTFQIRVNYANANGEKSFFKVTETSVVDDQIRFIWVVSADAVAYKGDVEFVVRFVKLNGSTVVQELNTTLANAKSLIGLSVDSEITPVQREDLLAHFYSEIDIYSEQKKNEILGSIPSDYAQLSNDVNSLKQDVDNFRFYESNGFFKFISNWHNGDVDSVGEFVDSKSTRRSDKVEASLLKCVEIITHNHNGCSVREWDINGRYLGSSWVTSSESIESRTNTFDFKSDTAYIAFTITGSNNYNANENNVDIKIFIEDYFLNDKSLQKALKIKKGFVSPVTDFGAYGNGLHNDTEALQNCIKFCIENSVPLKCEKAYQFMITNTLEFIGIDNSYTTGESENIVRTFKTINAEFDFNGSTILAYGNFAESSHTALYEGEEIPSVLYIKSTNLYDMHFEIKNLFIDVRKINCVCVYADELKKSTFRNITIKHLAKIGIYIENNCGGIMFYDTQMIANKKKAIGFWNASSDCYFDGIYMVDVTYGMILSASYCNIKKFHPFILTPSFVLGSVMFKLLSRNASGKYVGESTIILDQCYADTYNIVFDVSSHIGHRIISTGMTYINNTQILNNLFGKDTPSKMICVFTMKNKGYANKIKLSSNYMSGYKKEDKVYTYLCDSEGDESLIDDMSVISNVNYNNGELIN